jgi:AcrR family transcriptional regulator
MIAAAVGFSYGGTFREDRKVMHTAVLRTAAQLFIERGYHETSLDEIAQTLKVTKPVLYRYIENKEEILFECKNLALGSMLSAINQAQLPGQSGLDRVLAVMRAYALYILDDYGMWLVLVRDTTLNPDISRKPQQAERELNDHLRSYIEQGINDGSIVTDNSKMLSFLLFGAMNWIPHWCRAKGELSPAEIVEHFIGYMRSAMAGKNNEGPGSQFAKADPCYERVSSGRKPPSGIEDSGVIPPMGTAYAC